MQDNVAMRALKRKRGTLLGDIVIAREVVDKLLEDLACLDATILLFDPTVDTASIKPIVRRLKDSPFKYGELSKMVRAVLREADEPITITEIAQRVAVVKELDVSTPVALKRLCKKVQNTLWRSREGLTGEACSQGYRWSDDSKWFAQK